MNKEKGFTLVELLVVFALIGGLIALVINGINIARRNSRDTTRKTDLQTLQLMLEEYYNTNRVYPATANVTSNNRNPSRISVTAAKTFTSNFKGITYVDCTMAFVTSSSSATAAKTVTKPTNVKSYICYTRVNPQQYTLTTNLEAGGTFTLSNK